MDRFGGGFVQRAARRSLRWALCGAAATGFALGAAQHASAQSIEPGDLVPAPDGTNALLGYYIYEHEPNLQVASHAAGHGEVPHSNLDANVFIARYVHWAYIGDTPAGFQLLQTAGAFTGLKVGGTSFPDATGADTTILSVFAWPGASTATKTYPFVGIYLYPPFGTYDKTAAFNTGSPAWSGALQIGLNKGIGDNLSFDLTAFGTVIGDSTSPGGVRTTSDVHYTLQGWASWNWTPQFQTSIGWQTDLGGATQANGTFTGNKSEDQIIRGAVSYFFTPSIQGLVNVDHAFVSVGGFKEEVGVTARVLYVF